VQLARTASLTQAELEKHVFRLRTEITLLEEHIDATAYETDGQVVGLTQRVAQLEEDMEQKQKVHQEEMDQLQHMSAVELKSEQDKLKASANLKIRVQTQELRELQVKLDASTDAHARLEHAYAELQKKKAAEVASLQQTIEAFDPTAYAITKLNLEEEADLLACRQRAEGAQHSSCVEPVPQTIPIPPSETASKPSQTINTWPGHDGSRLCFKGVPGSVASGGQPESEKDPGSSIRFFLLGGDDLTKGATSVPTTLQRIHSRSPAKTISMEEQQEKQTQPAQPMQEPEEPPMEEQQGAAEPLKLMQEPEEPPMEEQQGAAKPLREQETPPMGEQQENVQADLQGAAEPLSKQETQPSLTPETDGTETDDSWCHVPECNGSDESNQSAAAFWTTQQEARGISHYHGSPSYSNTHP